MAHFAFVHDNLVQQVIVISNDYAPDPFPESESLGQALIASIGLHGQWKQTSYHGTFRKNFAGIGYTYDEQRDAFIPPQPFPSWILNEDTCLWDSPVPYPDDGGVYQWDEEGQQWAPVSP